MALMKITLEIDTQEDAEKAANRIIDVLGRLTQRFDPSEAVPTWDPQGAEQKVAPVKREKARPTEKAEPEVASSSEAETEKPVSKADIQHKMAALMNGHRDDLKALFEQFKASKLSELDESKYPAFMKALEAI